MRAAGGLSPRPWPEEVHLRDAHDDLSSLMDFWRAVAPATPASALAASNPPVAVIADRYVLGASIGQGGGGEVHRAVDRLSGDTLAIKLIAAPAPKDLDRTRREINALRWLRLPGVVHMRDDGVDHGRYFIAMDLVDGAPFPGRVGRRWEALAPLALDLFEVLARVHLAGVVHRDLKPGNVLVDAQGRPVLLDFGLAWGDAVVSGQRLPRAEGTPRYVAPEQLVSQPTDQRADLYSAGVMLYEALAGRAPHGEGETWELLRRKIDLPAPPLRSFAPQVPRHVALVIDRLLERRPDDRPATAMEVIALLGGRPPVPSAIDRPLAAPRGPADLRGLFNGPSAFSHLAEDAAQALWLRTGGQVDRIADELDGWVRSGLAHLVEGRLDVDRVALAQLESGAPTGVRAPADPPLTPDQAAVLRWVRLAWPDATTSLIARVSGMPAAAVDGALQALYQLQLCWRLPDGRVGTAPALRLHIDDGAVRAARLHLADHLPTGSEARVRQLVAARADPQRLLPDVLATAGPRVELGMHSVAIALLELGLREARRVGDAAAEAALITLRVRVALEQEAPVALDRALYEVGRCEPRQPLHDALDGLLRAVRLVLVGERGRARRLADALPAFDDESLEVWRQAARVQAAYGLPLETQEELLLALQGWADAGAPTRRAKLAGWWGNLRYKQGRYADAAALHEEAASAKAGVLARVSSQINAATALLEAPDLERARALATEAARHARRARHARYEARATWLLRAADYRADRAGPARPELVEAAAAVAAPEEALLATTEAAAAWRSGAHELAAQLATRGARAFALRQTLEGELLCRALALAAAPPDDRAMALAIADRLGECRVPDVAVQVLGLLRFAAPELDAMWMARLQDLLYSRPPVQHHRRLDVLSHSEAVGPRNPLAHESAVTLTPVVPDPNGAAGCDDEPPTVRVPEAQERLYLHALAGLAAESIDRPPRSRAPVDDEGCDSAPAPGPDSGVHFQLDEGTVNIVGLDGANIGRVLTRPLIISENGSRWVEEWIAFDAAAVDAAVFDLRHQQGGQNRLDATLKASLLAQAAAEGRVYRYARLAFDYRAPPSMGQINLLPLHPPAGATNQTRSVECVAGVVATEAGRLFRTRLLTGTVVDHWMLFENFQLPGGALSARVGGLAQTQPYSSARDFLTDMNGLRQSRGNPVWRYVQIVYTSILLADAAALA